MYRPVSNNSHYLMSGLVLICFDLSGLSLMNRLKYRKRRVNAEETCSQGQPICLLQRTIVFFANRDMNLRLSLRERMFVCGQEDFQNDTPGEAALGKNLMKNSEQA